MLMMVRLVQQVLHSVSCLYCLHCANVVIFISQISKKRQNMFYNIHKNLDSALGYLWPRFGLGWWKTWWKTF